MKKIFTLIAAAFVAVSVNAQSIYDGSVDVTEVDGYSAVVYEDGAMFQLLKDSKTYSAAATVTINGEAYKTVKLSNGAQNKFTAPSGKKVYSATFYSYVNKDSRTDRPAFWKEVNGESYSLDGGATEMNSFKDGENPDVNTYKFANGVSSFTFTNTGEQLCFVLVASYDSQTGINDVQANVAENNVAYNLAGQKVSDSYKGVVIINGKKVIK